MPQYNSLNLPGIDRAVQGYQANAFNMERAKTAAEREDQAYDDETRMKNTRFLAGATKVLMDIYDRDPDQFYVAADELGKEGIDRGIIDPQRWDPQLVTIEKVREMHNAAMVGLGGEAPDPDSDLPARVRTAQYYMGLDDEEKREFRDANAATKGMQTVKVPMPDGSEIMVNYDKDTGQGYDLTTGKTMIVRPGADGPLVYGDQGLIGPGQLTATPTQAQAPSGFGRSQTPSDKKRSELETQREFDALKVTEQNLTMMENAFRLEPMMIAAAEGASGWNTAWGSMLASVPGSSAKDLASTVTTIKANIGFDRLQRMRAESPTGGALGQVAVQELVALQSTIANLDQSQSTEQFKANMQIALSQYQSWRRKWGEAIMREGSRDQKMRYYNMVPEGSPYMHPDGGWRIKGSK